MSLDTWAITTTPTVNTFGNFEYKILNNTVSDSGSGSLSNASSQTTLAYIVDFADLGDFTDALLGTTSLTAHKLTRTKPAEHPGFKDFYCNRVDFEPLGKPSNAGVTPEWNKVKVTAIFQPVPFNVKADNEVTSELQRFCIKNLTSKMEFLNTGIGGFYFCNTAKTPLQNSPGILTPSATLEITWLKLPASAALGVEYAPTDSYAAANLGSINSTSFENQGTNWVLFSDYKSERVLPSSKLDGVPYWNAIYTFEIRRNGGNGWNWVYNTVDKAWQEVTTTGVSDGTDIYQQTLDFNTLFDPVHFT